VTFLRDREFVGGGWNYGNREVLGVDLPPFVQTTAISLVGLSGRDQDLDARGLGTLRRIWRDDPSEGDAVAEQAGIGDEVLELDPDRPSHRECGTPRAPSPVTGREHDRVDARLLDRSRLSNTTGRKRSTQRWVDS
jgi:hypothetical protein